MAVNATVANRITDLIGSSYSTIPSNSYKDLINAAFNEIADSIKPELLLKYSRTPGRLEGATEWLVEDRKILKVKARRVKSEMVLVKYVVHSQVMKGKEMMDFW